MVELDTLDISVTTNGSSHVAQLPIGYDDETGLRYSLFVATDMVAGYGRDTKELIFCVLRADPESGEVDEIWDGLVTRLVVTERQHRAAIMGAVAQMVRALIDDVKPRVVVMNTHTANLPQKALVKYHYIASIFHAEGYVAGPSDVWHGLHTWMMERRA
ncbi:hypothetical protein [Aureimonas psammosilenae]|uniref:hypothetical protein n=1 Tax=Aureimonas psammosilenae TaxID=2495496 RepID=UPI0012612466|nr:hypothetical protein [Aureimonas psammosilenae]